MALFRHRDPSGPAVPVTHHPVVLELFTSQGCSSCPPADALLTKLMGELGSEGLIPLAFHVDYWDRLGWVDPFSQKMATERQLEWVRRFGLRSMYTPQAVIGGRAECVGSDAKRVGGYLIQEGSRAPLVRVELTAHVAALSVEVDVAFDGEAASMLVALVEDGLVTGVRRGENAGARLRNDAVVRSFVSGALVSGTVRLKRPPGEPAGERRVVAVAYAADGGVVGARSIAVG